jgi:methionyl-tRNA formyltransferase
MNNASLRIALFGADSTVLCRTALYLHASGYDVVGAVCLKTPYGVGKRRALLHAIERVSHYVLSLFDPFAQVTAMEPYRFPTLKTVTRLIPGFERVDVATHNDPEVIEWLQRKGIDIALLLGTGILKEPVLKAVRIGFLNGHSALLPKYRGAAPIQWAVANGETETGVCTMQIDEGLDTGPVYLCEKTPIEADETVQQLSERLSKLGSDLVVRTLHGIVSGILQAAPQDNSKASVAPILQKSDGYIDWQESAQTIHNRVRAFNPWPGAVTRFRGGSFRILRSRVGPQMAAPASRVAPGTIAAARGCVAIVCGDGANLELIEVQLPGRKPVSGSDFANGMRIQPGESLEREDGKHL